MEIAGPFACDAKAPDLTEAKALMAHHNHCLYPSESLTQNSSEDKRSVRYLPVDPYEAEEFDMDDIKKMHAAEYCRENCTVMRGSFRDHTCLLEVVDVNEKCSKDQVCNEIAVYKHLESLQGKVIPRFLDMATLLAC